ncbi:helix-turn-helix domain-containing protein [Rhizobium rhizosphaerae]|uniref:helix-turn-helix domain-containing protein n=1 Tax=Xaviernesmea rhizosphaerae TaxID=1672749 RepID=UPI000A9D70CD|nr:LexA family transcriptional regulator [Xaviernesmea rhizosphaerae]
MPKPSWAKAHLSMGYNPSDFRWHVGQCPSMSGGWKERVRQALDEQGLSMKEASIAAGMGETFVRDILERDRTPKIDHFMSLAVVLKKPVSFLLGEAKSPEIKLRRVEVRAFVQAGIWEESWEWLTERRYDVFVPDDAELKSKPLYAAETRGPSMNKRYPENTVVVFTKLIETRERPIPGKRYIVERKRASGEVEHTVKLLHKDDNGRLWLLPESTDPLFQAPISLEDGMHDGDEVTVIGKVVYAISKE